MRRFSGPDVLSNVYIQPNASPNILSAHFFKHALFFSCSFLQACFVSLGIWNTQIGLRSFDAWNAQLGLLYLVFCFWTPCILAPWQLCNFGAKVLCILALMKIVYFRCQIMVYFGPHEDCIFLAPAYCVFSGLAGENNSRLTPRGNWARPCAVFRLWLISINIFATVCFILTSREEKRQI